MRHRHKGQRSILPNKGISVTRPPCALLSDMLIFQPRGQTAEEKLGPQRVFDVNFCVREARKGFLQLLMYVSGQLNRKN